MFMMDIGLERKGRVGSRAGLAGHLVAILLLPALVLWRQDNVLFTKIGTSDPWFYVGFGKNLLEFKRYLFRDTYYGSRLAWILPSWAVHHLFSPVAAACVLHLLVWLLAALSLFFALRIIAGERSAFLTTLLMGTHPWFWNATGWDYPDGAAIAWFLLAIAFYARAAGKPSPKVWLFLAGVAGGMAIHNTLTWVELAPLAVLTYIGMSWTRERRSPWRSLADATLWSGLGGLLLTLGFGLLNYWMDGNFWFFVPSIRQGRMLAATPIRWLSGVYESDGLSPWLWLGAAVLLISVVSLFRRRHDPDRSRSTPALACVAQFLIALALLAYGQTSRVHGLSYTYYASALLPFAFLVVGTTLWRGVDQLDSRTYLLLCAVGVGCFGFFWSDYAGRILPAWHPAGVVAVIIAALMVGALWVKPPAAASLMAIASFFLLTVEGRPTISPDAHLARRNYQRIMAERERIETVRHGRRIRFWFNEKDPEADDYAALVSTYLINSSFFSDTFPGFACDSNTAPDTGVVVLSTHLDAPQVAARSLADCWRQSGLGVGIAFQDVVQGAAQRYTITTLFAAADPAQWRPVNAILNGPGPAQLAPADHLMPLPLSRWRALPGAAAEVSSTSLQVRTSAAAYGFAAVYPPMVAPATGLYRFTLQFEPGSGHLAFGAYTPADDRWIVNGETSAFSEPGTEVASTAHLSRGQVFALVIANNNNEGPGAASCTVRKVVMEQMVEDGPRK